MKKKILFIGSGLLIFILLAYISGAPPGYTGAPGDATCHLCHMDFPVNSGSASTSIQGIHYYTPSQTYTITASINPTQSTNINGFELVVLEDAGNTNTGTITLTDVINTQIVTGGGKQYITFTEEGSSLSSWSFDWTAPSDYVGPITFYAAFNDADGGGDFGDDFIYTTSLTVDSVNTSGINNLISNLKGFKVYPNPAIHKVNINYTLINSDKVEISLIDIMGKDLFVLDSKTESQGNHTHEFDISEYTPGLYFLSVKVGNERSVYKIIKSIN